MARGARYYKTQEEREYAVKWLLLPHEYAAQNAREKLATCHPGMRIHWQHTLDGHLRELEALQPRAANIMKNGC